MRLVLFLSTIYLDTDAISVVSHARSAREHNFDVRGPDRCTSDTKSRRRSELHSSRTDGYCIQRRVPVFQASTPGLRVQSLWGNSQRQNLGVCDSDTGTRFTSTFLAKTLTERCCIVARTGTRASYPIDCCNWLRNGIRLPF